MKYTILYHLSKLLKEAEHKQLISLAYEVRTVFNDLLNEEDFDGYEDFFANSVGLRGDVKPEEPRGGLTVDPFFFDPGDINY